MKGMSWPRALRARWFAVLLVGCAAGVAIFTWSALWGGTADPTVRDAAAAESPVESGSSADASGSDAITLPHKMWSAAGLEMAPARKASLEQPTWVTGTVALNEDRVAHIFPLVAGRVEEVRVRFGDRVQAGQVLAIVQSKEVGQAKLELFQNRHHLKFAQIKQDWQQTISENTQELIAALEEEMPIEVIEERFRDRPMGDYRQQLLSSYANFLKAEADYERIKPLAERSLTPAKNLLAAKTARDAELATLRAWMEQIKFDAEQQAMFAEHALREAQTQITVNETALKILGFSGDELAAVDPSAQGPALAHYPVKAPFDGTVISKDVVLLERVGPEQQILQIADLSTVWITADIYEQHLPLLARLDGETIRFRSNAYPGRDFEARVFYTGELVDEESRTVRLRALAENPDGILKPGMFGQVRLPAEKQAGVLQVPLSAVQSHEGEKFVFVHRGGDEFERRDIQTGRRSDETVEIVAGLKPGEPVVVSGGFALKSQMLADLLAEE